MRSNYSFSSVMAASAYKEINASSSLGSIGTLLKSEMKKVLEILIFIYFRIQSCVWQVVKINQISKTINKIYVE